MFITFLKFSDNRAAAAEYMAAHNDWIKKGFDDGVFLCTGSLTNSQGGAILAHNEPRDAYNKRISNDPFVQNGVVIPETSEFSPVQMTDALNFLKGKT